MRDDGDVDYSRYTLRELEEALAGINKHQYPKNYANLRLAYERITGNRAELHEPEPAHEARDSERRQPSLSDKFWDSRPIRALLGLFCFWWSYDLFIQKNCPSGRKLTGAIIKVTCEKFGHHVAAGIPLALGLVLVFFATFPRRSSGA
jgi:hypothetical protein